MLCVGGLKKLCILAVQPRALDPERVNIYGAAARYRRATVGSSYDDARPDNKFNAAPG
jgi:hypothetical protein